MKTACQHRTLLAMTVALGSLFLVTRAQASPTPPQTEYDRLLVSTDPSFKASEAPSDGAGDQDGSVNAKLRREEERRRIAGQAGGGVTFGYMDDTPQSDNDDGPEIARLTGPNTWCNDPESGCVVDSIPGTDGTEGNVVSSAFSFGAPMGSVTDTLNSKVYVNQVTANLASPLAVLTSTMNLTEPGLARGMMDSMQVAGMATTARLQADNNVFARAQVYGNGERFAAAYDSKIARLQANEGKTWLEAQSAALGDRSEAASANFDTAIRDDDKEFNFLSDPNHPKSKDYGANGAALSMLGGQYSDGSQFNKHKIRGVDYLFNRQILSTRDDAQKSALVSLWRSFQYYVGDIELTVGPPQAGTLDPQDGAATANSGAGAAVMQIRRIAPGIKPANFYRALVIDRYKDLHGLLYMRCKFITEKIGESDSNDLPEMPKIGSDGYLEPSTAKANFYADLPGVHHLIIRSSTVSFRPQPSLFEALYGMYLDERNEPPKADDCKELLPDSGKPSDIFQLLSRSSTEKGRVLAANWKPRTAQAFFLAKQIALGQFLGTMAEAERYVLSSAVGSYSSLVKENLLNLIHQVAGTNQIASSIEKNTERLRGITLEIGDRYRIRNHQAGTAFSASYSEGGKNNAGMNGINGQ